MRTSLTALRLALAACFPIAGVSAQPLIPKPEWLVPGSCVIVIAEASEQHSLKTASAPMSAPKSEYPFANASVTISKLHLSKVILGDPPAEPIIITFEDAFSSESDAGISKGSMLLFLAPFDSRTPAYRLVRSLPIDKGRVPWVSKTSAIRMEPTPIDEVVAQLERYLELHPPKPTPTPMWLPPAPDLLPPPGLPTARPSSTLN